MRERAPDVSLHGEVFSPFSQLCEAVGADAKEVERALKSDPRVGPGAYLSPGAAFAGGTLARDVVFLHLDIATGEIDILRRNTARHCYDQMSLHLKGAGNGEAAKGRSGLSRG
mgnify:CR=1 FL=1